MGQVWRGVHREQDLPVALKVVTEPRARSEEYRRRFRDEVRAAAALTHPAIVDVFDYGDIPVSVEAATFGGIVAGSPYLIMELCDGSLADHRQPRSWDELRATLLTLLDALAHAHARGVIHRDIKPANVLTSTSPAGDPTIKLGDFSLSYLLEQLGDSQPIDDQKACGTPSYAAPEQLTGRWRDIGPWTDLYGLGCLAWELAGGRPPFRGHSVVEIGRKQLFAPLPPLEPNFPVPDELEAWLHRLLQKAPAERYSKAADAAWALTYMSVPSTIRQNDQPKDDLPTDDLPKDNPPTPEPLEISAPHIPVDWKYGGEPRPSAHLLGAGLQLYGLRRIPVHARHDERDRLWDALLEVTRSAETRAVLIDGTAGAGKSCLARWLCEHADEVGAANSLRVAHNPGSDTSEGLVDLLERYFRCQGLDADQIVERLEAWCDDHDVDDPELPRALAELISAEADDRPDKPRPNVDERHRLVARTLASIARQRALILWLDDLQWSSDSLTFMQSALTTYATGDLPLLIVGTVRADSSSDNPQADDPQAAELLEAIGEHERVSRISVEPLSMRARTDLVEQLLRLEPALARRVADHTAGNPLFAEQLIGHWIERGVLDVGERGFVLGDGEEFFVPEELYSVWMNRLEHALGGAKDDIWQALELAAALGLQWSEDEWRACCRIAGHSVAPRSLEKLLSHALITRSDGDYAFVHSMLRESLERHARDHGRWREHNRACARMLAIRRRSGPLAAERLGRHYLEGAQWRESLDPLLEALKWRGNMRQTQAVYFLLDLRATAIDELDLSDDDPIRLENWFLRALTHAHCDRMGEALELGGRAVDNARAGEDKGILCKALYRSAQVNQLCGQVSRALSLLEESHALLGELDADAEDYGHFVSGLRFTLGELTLRRGDAREAMGYFEELLDAPDIRRSERDRANTVRMIGNCKRVLGDFDGAQRCIEEAAEIYETLDHSAMVAECRTLRGNIARAAGDFDRAEAYYQRAITASRDGHRRYHVSALIGLGWLEIETGRFADATPRFTSLLEETESQGSHMLAHFIRCAMLPCLAHAGDFARLDDMLDEVRETFAQHGTCDPDLAVAAEIAAELAGESGEDERVRALLGFARSQRDGCALT